MSDDSLGTLQSRKQALAVLGVIVLPEKWKPVSQGEHSLVYQNSQGETLQVVNKGRCQWSLVKGVE